MARYLFIVSRRNPGLHSYLVERFLDDDNVRVILDRRGDLGMRAETSVPPPPPTRERRRRPDVDEEVHARSHAIVTLA